MSKGFWQFLLWLLWCLEWIALAALSCVGFALSVNPANRASFFLKSVVEWVHEYATILGFAFGAFIAVVRFLRWTLRGEPAEKQILDRITRDRLDEFREVCFPGLRKNVPLDHNRVTIFKHHWWVWLAWPFRGWITPWGAWRWPWSGWLVIYMRSGHQTQSVGTVFLAPDDAEHCEGVAGQAWRRRAYRVGRGENKLPDLRGIVHVGYPQAIWWSIRNLVGKPPEQLAAFARDKETIRNYAEATHCSPRFVWQRIKRKRRCPTSMLAVELRDRDKEPWGVLVMDSCNDFECIDSDSREFRTALTKLTDWLQKSGAMED